MKSPSLYSSILILIALSILTTGCPLPPGTPEDTNTMDEAPMVISGDTELIVRWNTLSTATAYEVWYAQIEDTESAVKFGDDVAATTVTITSLTNFITYYVWIKAKNGTETSPFSKPGSGTPMPQPRIRVQYRSTLIPNGGAFLKTMEELPGYTSYGFPITLYNDGTANLSINNISFSGAAASQFIADTSESVFPVAPGASGIFRLKFNPSSHGIKNTAVTISSNDSLQPSYSFSLTGDGFRNPGSSWTANFAGGIEITSSPNLAFEKIACSADGSKIFLFNNTSAYFHSQCILVSEDTGNTWHEHYLKAGQYQDIACSSDGNIVFVIGDRNLFVSKNGGRSWSQLTSGGGVYAMTCSSDGTRIAILKSNMVFTSTDSGVTWTERAFGGSGKWTDIQMSNDGIEIAVVGSASEGYIYKSTDGGVTWTELASAGQKKWNHVYISGDGGKMAASTGDEYLYVSGDSGKTWSERTLPGTGRYWKYSPDGSTLRALGFNNGLIYVSVDNGETWSISYSNPECLWICLSTSYNGNIIFATTVGTGDVYISEDHGQTWSKKTCYYRHAWTGIASSADGSRLTACDAREMDGSIGYIHTSYDYGRTWTAQTQAGLAVWYDVSMSADGNIIAACSLNNGIVISRDGGQTWATISSLRECTSITMSQNGMNIAICREGAYITISKDGGETWTTCTSAGAREWESIVSSFDGKTLAACAGNGTPKGYIYTSDDGGATWTERNAPGSRQWNIANSISISADGKKIIAASHDGYVFSSPDGGVTWIDVTPAAGKIYSAVASSADGERIAVAVAREGLLYISLDRGMTWYKSQYDGFGYCYGLVMSYNGLRITATDLKNFDIFTSP